MAGTRQEEGAQVGEKVTRWFAVVAVAEACSWLALLVSMAFKYGPSGNELGVQIFGMIHGVLFMAYGLLTLLVAGARKWGWGITLVALACAIPPFTTLVFERWARRRGRLGPAAEPSRAPAAVG